ncbi:DEAD/DEAH box helicase [Phocaeicola vulgatus]|uniref:DEAD/DEAH box helicase n=2 Tax=Bacteroidaceae TaxID=815 RepID=A0A6G0GQS9_PHOVU|nr:Eco57I restriction-modification methylase domain-containing protein [Phocaeicola vulgatus]KAB6454404.1 DEAD/DEAH box helicase [Phocaeicola vulgatus]KAB6479232.1 DEAD/DEAH box helicase [Phocaeicola vulgatus]MDB1041777.1 Eco57I restriction-modification methylase domain-containing protein [Phocaeicola vulgatus]
MIIESTLKAKLIYVFGIDDKTHEGCLKIGEATLDEDADLFALSPNCEALNNAAHKRISQYTQTAGIQYHLFHTELAMRTKDKQIQGFNDKAVHDVLLHSGLKRKDFNLGEGKASEWFIVDLNTAIAAIKAVKANKEALDGSQITSGQTPIILRNEQRAAIEQTKTRFVEGDQMLWNAKMRFGKTLTALQLFKELSQAEPKQYRRMLILTHRPVVNDGWFDDFHKIFFEVGTPYMYGSKTSGNSFQNLEAKLKADRDCRYVYFASIQDLRGSSFVGGKFQKNDELFSAHWDLLVIDEAHEGTQTDLGDKVLKALIKKGTKTLSLSGTPFNLFGKFKQDDIYTWSYVDEQREKEKWEKEHEGDHNPYGSLPRMNMFTYDLGPLFERFQDSEYSFNFHEFFRTDDNGDFVHQEHVDRFLDMMCDPSEDSNYPFSTKRYQEYFRHTFWLVPGVKEALALQYKLEKHPIFCNFDVVNVAGDGDPDDPKGEALQKVRDAIIEKPKKDYTITLSCGKLTTGVTVKEWTAVFMLSGSAKTGAANYMQTIFRVQSPGQINGKQKTDAYVFDFAPDRVLTMMAQAAKAPTRPGKQTEEHRQRLKELLNFFPIIALQGSQTRRYDVDQLLTRLKHTYIERVVNSGFDNNSLYNDRLLELDDVEIEEFDELKGIIGSTPSQDSGKDIIINDSGFDEEETAGDEKPEKKPKTPLADEEKAARKEMKKKKEMRKNAISILRGISIRMPMLIYGCDLKDGEDITIDNFAEHIDPRSWEEFMPQGITKQHFNNFKKYYDPEIFLEAGRQIRARARKADGLPVKERIRHIVEIFSSFRNPDKETVLTPWRVVNMHLSDTIGGYDFYEESHTEMLNEPRFVDRGSVTNRVFMRQDTRILELNSKSGLYPLYMAYSIWRERCREWERQGYFEVDKMTIEEEQLAWDDVIANNIFVVCKTPMAVSITKRTLTSFRDVKQVNARYYADLVETLKTNPESFTKDVVRGQYFWHNKNAEKEMKFNAIVGNPPYQVMDGGIGSSAVPVYHHFVNVANRIDPQYVSLIMPAKWYSGGRGLDSFRQSMLSDRSISHLFDFIDSHDCFTKVDIAGGVCYFLRDKFYNGNCVVSTIRNGKTTVVTRNLNELDVFVRTKEELDILDKIKSNTESFMSDVVLAQKPFGLRTYETPLSEGDIVLRYNKGKGLYLRKRIETNSNLIDKWKVITSCATNEHAGETDKNGRKRIISTLEVLKPGEICTETYMVISTFESEKEANSCIAYIKTNLVRFMLAMVTTTQHLSKSNFQFVPLQDFSEPWTDEKLYAKYGITPDEQAYIESLIKPME